MWVPFEMTGGTGTRGKRLQQVMSLMGLRNRGVLDDAVLVQPAVVSLY